MVKHYIHHQCQQHYLKPFVATRQTYLRVNASKLTVFVPEIENMIDTLYS